MKNKFEVYQETPYLVAIVKAIKEGKSFEEGMSDIVIVPHQWEVLTIIYSKEEIMQNEVIKNLLSGYKELREQLITLLLRVDIPTSWIAQTLADKGNFKSLILSDYFRDDATSQESKTSLWMGYVKEGKYLSELYHEAMQISKLDANSLYRRRDTHQADTLLAKISCFQKDFRP